MNLTKRQLAVYTNGVLIDHTLYTDSLVMPSLQNSRVYGLDEHSRLQQDTLFALLTHYVQEPTLSPKDKVASALLCKTLEAELASCAFVIYVPGESSVTYLYFPDTAVPMPAGMKEEMTDSIRPFALYKSTEFNMDAPFVGSSPDTHVFVKA